jgi:hypothetical protein
MSNETILYLAKPFYENIIYYILLMTKEILNMCDYNNGYGLPKDGWRQSYIEYKSYNTRYEDSKNLIAKTDIQSKLIDVDGPWIYSALQQFIYSYLT